MAPSVYWCLRLFLGSRLQPPTAPNGVHVKPSLHADPLFQHTPTFHGICEDSQRPVPHPTQPVSLSDSVRLSAAKQVRLLSPLNFQGVFAISISPQTYLSFPMKEEGAYFFSVFSFSQGEEVFFMPCHCQPQSFNGCLMKLSWSQGLKMVTSLLPSHLLVLVATVLDVSE